MDQYISKAAIVKEIERQMSAIDNYPKLIDTQIAVLEGNKIVLTKLLSFLDTLEVKESNFEKEFNNYADGILACDVQFEPFTHLHKCAKHFFELGLNSHE